MEKKTIKYKQKSMKKPTLCRYCRKGIHSQAQACSSCGHFVSWWGEFLRPAVLPSIVITLLGLTFAFYQFYDAKQARINEKAAVRNFQQANATFADLQGVGATPLRSNEVFSEIGEKGEQALLVRNFKNSPQIVAAAIKLAFILKNSSKPVFRWGGKSPEEGFDSSGFVAYVLSQIHALDEVAYRFYNTTKLVEKFQEVPVAGIKPGDLMISKSGFAAFYIGEQKGIGIGNAHGIQIVNLELKNMKILRWY